MQKERKMDMKEEEASAKINNENIEEAKIHESNFKK
jgi:hypothetical protein